MKKPPVPPEGIDGTNASKAINAEILAAASKPPKTMSSKIKSAATEVTAQKTQTPIVAKLTQCETDVAILKLKEFAFLSNPQFKYGKTSVISKKENTPNFTSIKLVWHNYYNAVFCVCKVKKEPGWVTDHPGTSAFLLLCRFCNEILAFARMKSADADEIKSTRKGGFS